MTRLIKEFQKSVFHSHKRARMVIMLDLNLKDLNSNVRSAIQLPLCLSPVTTSQNNLPHRSAVRTKREKKLCTLHWSLWKQGGMKIICLYSKPLCSSNSPLSHTEILRRRVYWDSSWNSQKMRCWSIEKMTNERSTFTVHPGYSKQLQRIFTVGFLMMVSSYLGWL